MGKTFKDRNPGRKKKKERSAIQEEQTLLTRKERHKTKQKLKKEYE